MAKRAATKAGTHATAARPKAASKAEVLSALAERAGLSKQDIAGFLEALGGLIRRELGPKGPGIFKIPDLVKLTATRRPGVRARQAINPFTRQPMMIAARPPKTIVRARPLKPLRDAV
jgi:nucleoid DNA-binding protein